MEMSWANASPEYYKVRYPGGGHEHGAIDTIYYVKFRQKTEVP